MPVFTAKIFLKITENYSWSFRLAKARSFSRLLCIPYNHLNFSNLFHLFQIVNYFLKLKHFWEIICLSLVNTNCLYFRTKITQPPTEHYQVGSPNLLLHRSFPAVRNCIHCYAKSSLCCDAFNKSICAPARSLGTLLPMQTKKKSTKK